MKKILLIVFVGFTLAGCGEKKLTDEMFVGDWICNASHYEAKWNDNAFGEYNKIDEHELLLSFKIENGKFYHKGGEEGDWIEGSLVAKYENNTEERKDNDFITKINKTLVSNSQDEFKTIYETEMIFNDPNNSQMNMKSKDESVCTRKK